MFEGSPITHALFTGHGMHPRASTAVSMQNPADIDLVGNAVTFSVGAQRPTTVGGRKNFPTPEKGDSWSGAKTARLQSKRERNYIDSVDELHSAEQNNARLQLENEVLKRQSNTHKDSEFNDILAENVALIQQLEDTTSDRNELASQFAELRQNFEEQKKQTTVIVGQRLEISHKFRELVAAHEKLGKEGLIQKAVIDKMDKEVIMVITLITLNNPSNSNSPNNLTPRYIGNNPANP